MDERQKICPGCGPAATAPRQVYLPVHFDIDFRTRISSGSLRVCMNGESIHNGDWWTVFVGESRTTFRKRIRSPRFLV